MNRTVIVVKDTTYLFSDEMRPNWMALTPEEVESALNIVGYYAEERNISTDAYDNYNLMVETKAERRFQAIAAHLEGRSP